MHLVLKSPNSPENESYRRFAPPSAQAFQQVAFQSLHKSPREKGWLSTMSADFLDDVDVVLSSRKDGAHLRGVIFEARDTSEGIPTEDEWAESNRGVFRSYTISDVHASILPRWAR
jgi:hypothetical protein